MPEEGDGHPSPGAQRSPHDQQAESLCLLSPHSDLLGSVDKVSPWRAISSVTPQQETDSRHQQKNILYSNIYIKIL